MNLDITYCCTKICPYIYTCKRNIINYNFKNGEIISQCNFKHTNTNCDYYIKL